MGDASGGAPEFAKALQHARALQYYKRRDVQEAIVRHCANREVSPRYGDGFGKRPDVLGYPSDVLEFAKRKCTSFHVSEERWSNPLLIQTGMSRKEANNLRTGWDLVLDIDAKDWELSRLTAWLFIECLRDHGITSISCKFSGNKGWHIGVPFECFPPVLLSSSGEDVPTRDLFPELPRAVAGYMLEMMSKTDYGLISVSDGTIRFGWRDPKQGRSTAQYAYPLKAFAAMAGKSDDALFEMFCVSCNKRVEQTETYQLSCHNDSCQYRAEARYTREQRDGIDDRERVCPKCRRIMEFMLLRSACPHDSRNHERRVKLADVIQVDTVLLASRHLYRSAYSLHEKSGLVSLVIDPDDVYGFDKQTAEPKRADLTRTFLDPEQLVHGEAGDLALRAWRWQEEKDGDREKRRAAADFSPPGEAVPEEHFPPCIKAILAGMVDGKKRAMFALTNFLGSCGWSFEMIEAKLHEWNKRNPEPLREVIIKGHLHTVRMKKERILPPNCKAFYQELGVCKPDDFCSRIRNPGQYAIKHVVTFGSKKRARTKRDDEEKSSDVNDNAEKV